MKNILVLALAWWLTGCATESSSGTDNGNNFILNMPTRIMTDGANNRVLLFNNVPSNGSAADVVLGQPDFTSSTSNNGGVSAASMSDPQGGYFDGQRLYVADSNNHRVLIWNSWPTSNKQPADVVLGQSDMTTNTSGTSASKFNFPATIYSNGQRLFVADYNNHRILVWNSIPTSNGAPADLVLGQANMTSGSINGGGAVAANVFNFPAVFSDGTRLFVADFANHRVLIFNSLPSMNQASADVVLGQSTMNTGANGTSQTQMWGPSGVSTSVSGALAVSEYGNSRVMIWNSIPGTSGAPASVVVGQGAFNTSTPGAGAAGLNGPYHAQFVGNSLYVTDTGNHRVLSWNGIPTANGQGADAVIGQSTFTQNSPGTSSKTFSGPTQFR